MFDTLIILYLFLGGAGSGLIFVMSMISLVFFRAENRTFEDSNTVRSLQAIGYVLGCVILIVAALCLVADLGRPDRIILLFTRPTTSLLSIGTFCLAGMILLSIILVMLSTVKARSASGTARKVCEFLSLFLAGATMTYTGLFLQNVHAVAFWNSYALPALFVVSSLSMGVSIIFLCVPYVARFSRGENKARSLHMMHIVLLMVEGLLLAMYLLGMQLDPHTAGSVHLLFDRDLFAWFAGGVLLFGLLIPFVSEVYALVTKRIYRFPISDVLCLVGGFSLRYCIVLAGIH